MPHTIEVRDPDAAGTAGRPALFLDRDGVLNRRRLTLVRRWNHFRFTPTALDALRHAERYDIPVIIATNQEWVGHGYIELDDLVELHERMIEKAKRAGGRIDAVYACIHPHQDGCSCRKPDPGMLTLAADRYGVDLARSWMVGDNAKDLRAGRAAGTRTSLVDPRLRTWLQNAHHHADHVFPNVLKATRHAIAHMRRSPRAGAAGGDETAQAE